MRMPKNPYMSRDARELKGKEVNGVRVGFDKEKRRELIRSKRINDLAIHLYPVFMVSGVIATAASCLYLSDFVENYIKNDELVKIVSSTPVLLYLCAFHYGIEKLTSGREVLKRAIGTVQENTFFMKTGVMPDNTIAGNLGWDRYDLTERRKIENKLESEL